MLKYIGFIFRVLPLAIWNYFSWILYYSHHKNKIDFETRYNRVRKFIIKVLKRLHVCIDATGKEYLLEHQVLMMTPNHQSFIDPLVLIAISEKPVSFIAKKEVERMPIVGRVFKIIDGEFLDRSNLHQQVKILRIMENSLLKNEHSWVVFPEGTRNKDIEHVLLNEFHPGTFKVALKGVYVLPVIIDGTQKVLSTKIWKKQYKVSLSILKALDNTIIKAQNSSEYRDYIFKLMKESLQSLRVENYKIN